MLKRRVGRFNVSSALRAAGRALLAAVLAGSSLASVAAAQPEGGLYIAGDSFTFQAAAQRALAQNPRGARFFILVLPPQTAALRSATTGPTATLRGRVTAAGGVLLVCQRDIDTGRVDASALVPGVVAVRGWPAQGGAGPAPGERYFAGEDPSRLPAADEALRRLRSTCA